MHPMERLRSVARAAGAGPGAVAREAAGSLAALGHDPAALVTACRRLVQRHPHAGPVWWLASRVLCAPDPVAEARRACTELDGDATAGHLAATLPEAATAVLLGWPEHALDGVVRRGDVEVLLVSAGGEATGLATRLDHAGLAVEDVDDAGLAGAVASAGVVVLEAAAMGPSAFVAVAGSYAAAAVGRDAGVPVWVVAGVGRTLPERLWAAVEDRLLAAGRPGWAGPMEVVPLRLCDVVIGPEGPRSASDPPPPAGCPVAPELLKPTG
ncbi:MAG: hypothetical protein ACRD0S_02565 [Acidimicrobiales bacterium]